MNEKRKWNGCDEGWNSMTFERWIDGKYEAFSCKTKTPQAGAKIIDEWLKERDGHAG